MEEPKTKIVSQEFYSTNGETLIIVKDIDTCKIELNSSTNEKIIMTISKSIKKNKIKKNWNILILLFDKIKKE